jgi:DNA polymerase I-like protein with 3'-5' exonuclease and polymerase domains
VKLHHRLSQSDRHVAHVCKDIAGAGPGARVVYDIETGASPELEALFKGKTEESQSKGALQAYAGAYITGLSVCVVRPGDFMRKELTGSYIPLGHERGNVSPHARNMLVSALGVTDATHVLHHSAFDWAFLLNEGLLFDVPRIAVDTQVARWLQDENGIKGLKPLGEMWLGEEAAAEQRELHEVLAPPHPKITAARQAVLTAYPELGAVLKNGKVSTARLGEEGERMAQQLRKGRLWGQLTVEELWPYAARDSTLTAEIDYLLDGTSPAATVEREMKVNAICVDMTRRGLSVDIDLLHKAAAYHNARAEEIGAELLKVHDLENPASSDQVSDLLYDRLGLPVRGRTKTGAPATDKNALEQLAGDPVAAQVLAYRHERKAADAYATPFAKYAELSHDGRIHGMFETTRTVTGRLACSQPNLMTIPRDDTLPEIRAAFVLDPAEGIERIGFDLASAELWVTASITQDPVLTEILQEGRNLHAEMMVQVFGGEKDKSRREYTLSKNVNYGIEYGAGLDQITIFAAKAGYSPTQARKVAKIARDGHKRMFAVQHQRARWWQEKAEELGKLPLQAPGRYRHFKSPGKLIHSYTALNALVQGGVAEFMKDTMIELYARGYGELLILQVHDELVFDVRASTNMKQELLDVLTKISRDINPFRYPLTWDAKSWSIAA